MSQAFFVVRNGETDPKDDRLKYAPAGQTGVKITNTFDDFDAAQSAAMEWAQKYKRPYKVYRVIEIGTAAPPAAPPAVWAPATAE